MVYLEHSGTKFWRCEVDENSSNDDEIIVATSFGKCGNKGRTTTKSFTSKADAEAFVAKQEASKRKGGYEDAEDPNAPETVAAATTPTKQKAATANTTPSKKKGLGGFAAPDPTKTNEVDAGVAGIDAALASRVEVHDTLHARLALVDPSMNSDKYYILQVLVEHSPPKKAKTTANSASGGGQFHLFTRWGRTGTGGQAKLEGPFPDEDQAKDALSKIFKNKTGVAWEEAVAGSAPKPGKYEYLATSSGNDGEGGDAKWYYWLENDPHGKSDGWYEYDEANSGEVEDLFGTYVASNKPVRLSRRVVSSDSSGYQYRVDLQQMEQTNTSSGTTRPIARTVNGSPPAEKRVAAASTTPKKKQKVVATPTKKVAPGTPKKVAAASASPKKTPLGPAVAKPTATSASVGAVDPAASSKLQGGRVYKDYNVMLNQTNIGANNNKFYKIQLIETSAGYTLFTKWGRVGEPGKTQEQGPYKDVNMGIKGFAQKFKSKTANKWEDYHEFKNCFVAKKGKYTVLEMEHDAAAAQAMVGAVTAASASKKYKMLPCQLDKTTKGLVDLIFDEDMFRSAMSALNLDPKKLPLGALSQPQIAKGYAVMGRIEEALKVNANEETLEELTSEFYTLIPHAFGRNRGPVLNTSQKVKEKYEMLNTLADIEAAQSMQRNVQATADAKDDEEEVAHPSDANYEQLAADLTLLDSSKDADYQLIETFFDDTKKSHGHGGGMKLRQVWRVDRHKEETRFAKHADITNRKLLWHGTNVAVVAAILKSGLRIMPHSGGRVGRGIYLADQHQKSEWYVRGARGTVIMFLVEAALGRSHEILKDDPSLTAAPPGFDSVLAKGQVQPPDEAELEIDGNTVSVPQGVPQPVKSAQNSSFGHNEFLIYKESQHRIRYVLAFDQK